MARTQEIALLIERLVAVLLFAALLVGVVLVLRPFFTAALFAGIVVIATWPVHEWFLRKGFSNGVVALILTTIAVAFIVAPAIALVPLLTGQLPQVVRAAQSVLNDAPALPNWFVQIPVVGARIDHLWSQLTHGEIQEVLGPYSATIRKTIIDVGGSLADAVLQIILSLAIAAMFWLRGDLIRRALEDTGRRFAGSFGNKLLTAAANSVKGVAYGIVGTAIAQAAALTVGMFIAGVPAVGALGFLALLIALSQIGILLVVIWGGAAWWLFSTGDQGWAIFMIVWGLFVSSIDNVIRPLLVGFGATMPLALIFLGVFGGFISFGFLGMFIGPTLLAVFIALFEAWRASESSTGRKTLVFGNGPSSVSSPFKCLRYDVDRAKGRRTTRGSRIDGSRARPRFGSAPKSSISVVRGDRSGDCHRPLGNRHEDAWHAPTGGNHHWRVQWRGSCDDDATRPANDRGKYLSSDAPLPFSSYERRSQGRGIYLWNRRAHAWRGPVGVCISPLP